MKKKPYYIYTVGTSWFVACDGQIVDCSRSEFEAEVLCAKLNKAYAKGLRDAKEAAKTPVAST